MPAGSSAPWRSSNASRSSDRGLPASAQFPLTFGSSSDGPMFGAGVKYLTDNRNSPPFKREMRAQIPLAPPFSSNRSLNIFADGEHVHETKRMRIVGLECMPIIDIALSLVSWILPLEFFHGFGINFEAVKQKPMLV